MNCPQCGEADYEVSSGCSRCGSRVDSSTSTRNLKASLEPDSSPDAALVSPSSSSFPTADSPAVRDKVSTAVPLAPGDRLGSRYRVVDRIGQGGMGAVYKAYDDVLERYVAVKVIRDDVVEKPEAQIRFRRELGLAQKVANRNVCRVHDMGEASGRVFLSMELLEGHTLADLIREVGRLSLRQTLDLAEQICAGLDAIHGEQIVHRDLKPSNIGITHSGRVVIMDFGIASSPLESGLTEPGRMVGTYAYLAPEQIRGGSIDERCDIYALGLVLYEMLTGSRPPGDSDRRPLAFRGEGTPCPPPSTYEPAIPRELDRLIMQCLAWEPAKRPASVEEVFLVLQSCRSTSDVALDVAARRPVAWWKWLAGAAALIGLAGVLTYGPGTPNAPIRDTVAVLPFHYTGSDAANNGLGLRVGDLLSSGLESISSLEVAPYDTVRDICGDCDVAARSAVEIARNLGVEKLVTGSVAVEGETVRISTMLLAGASGTTLWKSTVSGSLHLPSQPVQQVRSGLLEQLEVSSSTPWKTTRSPSAQAYDTYLEARLQHERWDIYEDLAKAVELYRQVLEIDAEFAAARASLARALVTQFYQTEDPTLIAAAREQLDLASTANPDLPEVLVAQGSVAEATGDTVESERAFRRAIERTPGNDTAYRGLGHLLADLGRHDEARSSFEQAVALRPGSWRNHYALGRYLVTYVNDIEAARVEFEKAYEAHREGVGPMTYLGNLDLRVGKLDDAEVWYRRILAQRPSSWAYYNLGVVQYYRASFQLALRNFQNALDREPDYPLFITAVGDAFLRLGERDQAAAFHRRALERYRVLVASQPNEYERRAELASLLATMGQCDEAGTEIDPILQRNPESADFLAKAAQIAADCGQVDRAIRFAHRTIDAGNPAAVRFDPALAPIREDRSIRQALENAGLAPD